MRNLIKPAALALAVLLVSTAGALACNAYANRATNVLANPAYGVAMLIPVVGHLDKGQGVALDTCKDKWCHILGPVNGWVKQQYLTRINHESTPTTGLIYLNASDFLP